MKRASKRHDVGPVLTASAAEAASQLECSLGRLCARVGEKREVESGDAAKLAGERCLIRVRVEVRGVNTPVRLIGDNGDDARVVVPEGVHSDSRNEIQVAAPFCIEDITALSGVDCEGQPIGMYQ